MKLKYENDLRTSLFYLYLYSLKRWSVPLIDFEALELFPISDQTESGIIGLEMKHAGE